MESIIRTVKDHTRCDLQNIPYKKCPKLMLVSYLEENITWMNALPKKNGISKTLSNSEIVLGTPKIDTTNITLQPVLYVYCKFKSKIMNGMKMRSVDEIKLRRPNKCGGQYVMYFKTGRQIHSYK